MDKDSQKLAMDLMKRGATLLREPCPRCGGILLRYKGRDLCPVDSGIKSVEEADALTRPVSAVTDDALTAAKAKLEALTKQLNEENDPIKVGIIIDDISKVSDLIAKLQKSQQSQT